MLRVAAAGSWETVLMAVFRRQIKTSEEMEAQASRAALADLALHPLEPLQQAPRQRAAAAVGVAAVASTTPDGIQGALAER
jgi:hypothetical protein